MSGKAWLYAKRGVGILLLIVIVLALFSAADELIGREDRLGQRNALNVAAEVLFMGSSHVHCGVIPQKLMDDYGIAALNESTSGLVPEDSLLMLKLDIPKYNPSVVLVDLSGFFAPYTSTPTFNSLDNKDLFYYSNYQRTARGMTWFNPEKYLILYEHEKQAPGSLPYGLMLNASHEFLTQGMIAYANPKKSRPYASKFNYWFLPTNTVTDSPTAYTDEELEDIHLYEPFRDILYEIIQLSENNDFSLVFTLLPFSMNRAEEKIFEEIREMIEAENVPLIDDETLRREAKIDDIADFNDLGHMSYLGASKITGVLGAYLDEHYDLPDRRLDDDPKYDPWKKMPYSYLADHAASQLRSTTDFETYMRYLADLNGDYTVLIASDGSEAFWQNPANAEVWSKWCGIDPQVAFAEDEGYVALLNGTEIHHQENYTGEYLYLDYVKENGYKAQCFKDWIISLYVDGTMVTQENLGLMMVVFDAVNDRVVDSVCFDFPEGDPVAIR